MVGQCLQGPQSVGRERKVFPLADTWSGARTGLGCIAIRSSEKNWGWALSSVANRQWDQAGRGIWVWFERGCEFYNLCPSEKHHLSESFWPRGFCTGGATKSQARSHWCHRIDKAIKSKIVFLWHHCDLMTGMDCILCNVLWILHLSRKTEAENTILLLVSMKLLPEDFTFGDTCIFLWVCMREKERKGN